MLIYCPKCRQGYNIDEKLIPENGRKLRCGSCGEIFYINKEDETKQVDEVQVSDEAEVSTSESVPEATTDEIVKDKTDTDTEEEQQEAVEEKIDVNDIFRRLSEQTVDLFEKEKKLTLRERWWLKFKTLSGFNFRIKLKHVVALVLLIMIASLYNNRYEITRKLPFMASVYELVGVKSTILGEGLEFQNIDWVYFGEGDAPWMEIKGFINNPTSRAIILPTVRVEMLDASTGLLKSQNQVLEQKMLAAGNRVALNIVVTKPSPTTKYVFLTFVETEN